MFLSSLRYNRCHNCNYNSGNLLSFGKRHHFGMDLSYKGSKSHNHFQCSHLNRYSCNLGNRWSFHRLHCFDMELHCKESGFHNLFQWNLQGKNMCSLNKRNSGMGQMSEIFFKQKIQIEKRNIRNLKVRLFLTISHNYWCYYRNLRFCTGLMHMEWKFRKILR